MHLQVVWAIMYVQAMMEGRPLPEPLPGPTVWLRGACNRPACNSSHHNTRNGRRPRCRRRYRICVGVRPRVPRAQRGSCPPLPRGPPPWHHQRPHAWVERVPVGLLWQPTHAPATGINLLDPASHAFVLFLLLAPAQGQTQSAYLGLVAWAALLPQLQLLPLPSQQNGDQQPAQSQSTCAVRCRTTTTKGPSPHQLCYVCV